MGVGTAGLAALIIRTNPESRIKNQEISQKNISAPATGKGRFAA
jgi:hypothetical protein